ncbi:hypothetical protein [Dyadobacter jiangsuensis]|uniref:Uncharacterized protein n=1 Tax=Dyadobacter jiangsuensis TaxID=1591085 RepID=A0A2P8FMJ5_9BACT|nr:hypothetical protein [Dyadobacter jiangsuensis]PSL22957.1 hypothetical protein CLV60_11889 [Dyadobacter jiangsuensis]
MKILRIFLLAFCSWVLWLLVSQFLFCPRYQFNDPIPFEGPALYNPYDSISSSPWVKCNFHAHAHAWEGVTNGHGTASDIHNAYKALHYGVYCVSNYHHIDTTHSTHANYLPAYEHGYNIRKTHQLVLGSTEVQWLDYLFPQTAHNKQHVLSHLSGTDNVLILNHPALKNGYTAEDLAQLANYDCMEVLNPSVTSTAQWDAALSAGKRVFIVGDDDIHDVISKERLGTRCTFVNVRNNSASEVIRALKTGKSYGVIVGENQSHDSIPHLQSLTVHHDTIQALMTQTASEVTITGQNGRVLALARHADRISYRITPGDRYVRVTFKYANGTEVLLNPVFFTPKNGYQPVPVYENFNETMFFRSIGTCILGGWLLLVVRLITGQRQQRYGRRRLSWR